jgi:hypothetical protein
VALGLGDSWQVLYYPFDPSDEDVGQIMERVSGRDAVIFCGLSRGPEPKGQRRLGRAAFESGKLRLAAALLDPYPLGAFPKATPKVAAYGYWPECLRALMEAVFGRKAPRGVLPVDIRGPI